MCTETTFQFYPGEDKELEIQLKTDKNGCREIYPLQAGDVITAVLPASPTDLTFVSTDASPKLTVVSDVYGKIKIALDATDTGKLITGPVKVSVVRASKTKIFVVDGKIEKLTFTTC